MRGAASVLVALACVLAAGRAGSAGPPTLEERSAAIEAVSKERDGERVVLGHISRELRLPVDVLRAQRVRSGLGWGDLLIANRLSLESGLTYDQVVAEFRGGKGWEAIARDHAVDVSKLTAEVQRAEEAVERRADDRAFHNVTEGSPARAGGSGGGSGGRGGGAGRGRY